MNGVLVIVLQCEMPAQFANPAFADLDPFLSMIGGRRWLDRLTEIRDLAASGPRAGQAILQRHGVELSLERLRRRPAARPSAADLLLGGIAAEIAEIMAELTARGRD